MAPPLHAQFAEYEKRFTDAINEDLNTPQALAVMWEMVRSDHPSDAKTKLLLKMDEVLGLNIAEVILHLKREQGIIPDAVRELMKERDFLRHQRQFSAADQIRAKIEKMGYEV